MRPPFTVADLDRILMDTQLVNPQVCWRPDLLVSS